MTRQPDHIVPVKVIVRLDLTSTLVDQFGGRRFVCCVAEDGTLADLRVVLVRDKVIDKDDGSIFVFDGGVVGNSSESHIKWNFLVKNDEVVLSRMSTSLLSKSKLGKGIIISGDNGPQYAGHAVIADGDSVAASLLDTQETCNETIHSYSPIAAEFARAGWSKSAMASVFSTLSDDLPHTNVWITGRHLYSACQLTLPSPYVLQPHQELKIAVEKALEEQDIARRRQKLGMVWGRYGTFYVDSVEMGGMFHATSMLDISQKNTGEAEMRSFLTQQSASDRESCAERDAAEKQSDIFTECSGLFSRVGGCQDGNYSQWKSSLAQPASWAIVRILQAAPIIELFDDDTQTKIMLSYSPLACDRESFTPFETASAFDNLAKDFGWKSTADDDEYGLVIPSYSSTELSDEVTQTEFGSDFDFVVTDHDMDLKNTVIGPSHSVSTANLDASVPEVTPSEPTTPAATSVDSDSGMKTAPLAEDSPDIVEREVATLLGQLTVERFDTISTGMIACANKSENETDAHTLKQISRAIFENAVDGTHSSYILACLCREMRAQISPKVQADEIRTDDGRPIVGGDLFREYLLDCCQEEFGRCWASKETTASQDQSTKLPVEEYHTAQKARRLGVVKFIGELFRVQILAGLIVHKCILKFLRKADSPEEEEMEGLCLLLTTVGDLLDTPKAEAHMNAYFHRMRQFANDHTVSSRVRSMLQDVIELRERRWVLCNSATVTTVVYEATTSKDRHQIVRLT